MSNATSELLCHKHQRPPEEHTAGSLIECYEFVVCPACEGDMLIDGRALCERCGGCGQVIHAVLPPEIP